MRLFSSAGFGFPSRSGRATSVSDRRSAHRRVNSNYRWLFSDRSLGVLQLVVTGSSPAVAGAAGGRRV